jgi:hypothetical protein
VHKNATSFVHLLCSTLRQVHLSLQTPPAIKSRNTSRAKHRHRFNHSITPPFSLSSFDAMRLGLRVNTLTTFLNYFGSRKVLSSSNSTHLPNVAGRSRSARLHAAKSAARVRNRRSTANAAASSNKLSSTAGTGTARGAKQRGTKYRRARMSPLTARKPLWRCNTVLVPQPPTHPQPPGAFVVPNLTGLDDRHLPPFVGQKLFFDALIRKNLGCYRDASGN